MSSEESWASHAPMNERLLYVRLVDRCENIARAHSAFGAEDSTDVVVGALLGIKLALNYPDLVKRWFEDFIKDAPPHGGMLDVDFIVTGIPEGEEAAKKN